MKLSFAQWMSMARGANLPTVWTNVIAAWAINAGTGPSVRWMPEWTDMSFFVSATLCYLLLGSSLIYAGGCFLNDACDHAFDLKHRPERPIPSRALSLGQAWLIGLTQLGLGAWVMIQWAGCSWPWTVALLLCILAYDWIHKKTAWGMPDSFMDHCRYGCLWDEPGPASLFMGHYSRAVCGGYFLVRPQ
jgi:4-hydroxybenzoate polyprenyltransferase